MNGLTKVEIADLFFGPIPVRIIWHRFKKNNLVFQRCFLWAGIRERKWAKSPKKLGINAKDWKAAEMPVSKFRHINSFRWDDFNRISSKLTPFSGWMENCQMNYSIESTLLNLFLSIINNSEINPCQWNTTIIFSFLQFLFPIKPRFVALLTGRNGENIFLWCSFSWLSNSTTYGACP
jgi:hypothetical protein